MRKDIARLRKCIAKQEILLGIQDNRINKPRNPIYIFKKTFTDMAFLFEEHHFTAHL